MRQLHRIMALALGSLLIVPLIATLPVSAATATGGAVYTISNDPSGNAVVVFARAADGTLARSGSVPTGGLGSGDGLGSQGAVALSDDGRVLLAVNAGSDSVSSFQRAKGTIRLTGVSPTGDRPVSVTIHGTLVYTLNDGADTLSGFRLAKRGDLKPISGSTIGLSGTGIDPAQAEFTPDGRFVVVTEKNTNQIDVYEVRPDGRLSAPVVQPSEGETPFGFAFDPSGRLIDSEAFGGAAGASAVSSYAVGGDGVLTTISPSVPDGQGAACWVAVTPDGRFAYTANTGSNTVSGYAIGSDGSLTLLGGGAFPAGMAPADVAVAGGFLYARNGGSHDVSAFAVGGDGALTPVQTVSGLPIAAAGLVAV